MRAKIMYNVRRVFKIVLKGKCRDFYNEILYCFPEKPSFKTQPAQPKFPKKNIKKQKNKNNRKNPRNNQKSVNSANADSLDILAEKLSLDATSVVNEMNGSNDHSVSTPDDTQDQIELPASRSELGNDPSNIVDLDAYSITHERFQPPSAKLPIRLDKYDADWMAYWRERAASWNTMSNDVDFCQLIRDVTVERKVDYYKPTARS